MADVELLHCMGDDLMVVDAARVSFSKMSKWDVDTHNKRVLSVRDIGLINYLATHNHWSPFSHPQVQFRIRMPLIIANQWFKHVVGFARNSVSRRYVSEMPTVFNPAPWRKSAPHIKQGSLNEEVDRPQICDTIYKSSCDLALKTYQELLEQGVAPEQARMVLPVAMYTEFIETASLYGYARLCRLRLEGHAQKEVRDYAAQISLILEKLFPVSWNALVLKAVHPTTHAQEVNP